MSGANFWNATNAATAIAAITTSRQCAALLSLEPQAPPIIGGAAAPRRSRSRTGAAAPSTPRPRASGRRTGPTAVGPEPATSARSAPTSSKARQRLRDPGTQRHRRLFEVVDEQLGVVQRRGAAARRRAQPFRDSSNSAASRPSPSGSASAYTSAVDRPGSSGISTTANSPGAGSGSTTSPAPDTSAGPARAATERRPPAPRPARGSPSSCPAARRRIAAASALPPPSPAATGIRLSISTRNGGRVPAPRAHRLERDADQVRPRRRRGRRPRRRRPRPR